MKCVALVVLMALAAANASYYVYAPPSLALRSLPGAYPFPYAVPRAYYHAASPQVVLSHPALRLAAPAPLPAAVAQPSLALAVPNAAVYRASNPGVTHEALLPGHSLSVLSENLELPPGGSNPPAK